MVRSVLNFLSFLSDQVTPTSPGVPYNKTASITVNGVPLSELRRKVK